jgi:RNA polymerase sigma factor (sigma-70 family)
MGMGEEVAPFRARIGILAAVEFRRRGLRLRHDDLQDIFQEVGKALLVQRAKERIENLPSFVLTVARRVARAAASRTAREVGLEDSENGPDTMILPAIGADPEQAALVAERRAAVGRAVGRLPEKYRLVIALAYGQGLGDGEIGRRLDLKPATVRTRKARAIFRLRRRLRES